MIVTRDDMSHYVRIGIAAKMLGVCTKTLRRWEQAEKLPCRRTVGGHRRIAIFEIRKLQGKPELERDKGVKEKIAIYVRVSSHEQKKKGDLERQIKVAQTFLPTSQLSA